MMKIVVTESQLKKFTKNVADSKVVCDSCGWSWKLSEGGDEPFKCHKCPNNKSVTIIRKKK